MKFTSTKSNRPFQDRAWLIFDQAVARKLDSQVKEHVSLIGAHFPMVTKLLQWFSDNSVANISKATFVCCTALCFHSFPSATHQC